MALFVFQRDAVMSSPSIFATSSSTTGKKTSGYESTPGLYQTQAAEDGTGSEFAQLYTGDTACGFLAGGLGVVLIPTE
ncbi:MAG: hypothetical protein MMC33_003885 [Icmadophila ericetorum]|nr:hypothetical protein [Icmadophila ericetorum]